MTKFTAQIVSVDRSGWPGPSADGLLHPYNIRVTLSVPRSEIVKRVKGRFKIELEDDWDGRSRNITTSFVSLEPQEAAAVLVFRVVDSNGFNDEFVMNFYK